LHRSDRRPHPLAEQKGLIDVRRSFFLCTSRGPATDGAGYCGGSRGDRADGVAHDEYLLNSFLRKSQDVFDLSVAFEMINFGSAENQEAMRAYRSRVLPEFDEGGSGFW